MAFTKGGDKSYNGMVLGLFLLATFLITPAKAAVELIDLGTLNGDSASSARAINNRGEIVGVSTDSHFVAHAFYFWNGRMTQLSSQRSAAAAINNAGQIVGNIEFYTTNVFTNILIPPIRLPTNIITIPPPTNSIPILPATNINKVAHTTGTIAVPIIPGQVYTNVIINDRAVLFRPGSSPISLEGTNYGYASAINNRGQIVGGLTLPNDDNAYAYSYLNGTTTNLPMPANGISLAFATGVNDQGEIVGSYQQFNPPVGQGSFEHPFLYQQGDSIDLGTLGGDNGTATAINDEGEIVGWSEINTNGETHAFLYSDGQMTDLGTLPGAPLTSTNRINPISSANAINNWGMIVGSANSDQGNHAFIWQNGTMTDLNTIVRETTLQGRPGFVSLISANGINDLGQIVGAGEYWDGRHESLRAFLLDLHL